MVETSAISTHSHGARKPAVHNTISQSLLSRVQSMIKMSAIRGVVIGAPSPTEEIDTNDVRITMSNS